MIVTERIARKFDAIIDTEAVVRSERASAEAGIDADTRARGKRHYVDALARLSAMIDALTAEEMHEFGAYRATAISNAK